MEPLLPVHVNTHRFGGGPPRVSDRRCADAIFYVLRTGGQWASQTATDLCAKSTAHDRFCEWVEAGVFLKLWQAGVEQFDELLGSMPMKAMSATMNPTCTTSPSSPYAPTSVRYNCTTGLSCSLCRSTELISNPDDLPR